MAYPIQIAIDCADLERQARFWSELLGYTIRKPDAADEPQDTCMIYDPDGSGPFIKFHRVPESKQAKNRLHLDVLVAGPTTSLQEARPLVDRAAARAVALGAESLRTFDKPTDYFVVMADPEGNEFCVG